MSCQFEWVPWTSCSVYSLVVIGPLITMVPFVIMILSHELQLPHSYCGAWHPRTLSSWRKHRIVETSWIPVQEFQIWRLILLTTQSHLCCAVCFHVLQDNSALDVELVAVALSVSPISGACIKSKLLYLLQNCVRFGWNSIIILHYQVQNSWYL